MMTLNEKIIDRSLIPAKLISLCLKYNNEPVENLFNALY